ncbi:ABC transporter ATP-binding protein [Haladaptatus caseinilyticus]|uniref:ABC transporter ATP-binding protein n=1 Tax=Haladaptatus caseinilyticus TaxID=2993314 RepID=UPI00224B22F4|nr:ABC transporter ATP-binding protein [Haladaptatus caseinilyticus]
MTDTLVAENLRKRYGDTVALDGVSLSVGAGEVFALIGPNGAGKTTLVRSLTGTTDPDEGSVSVLGGSPADMDKSRVGLLPQSFDPPARLSARELVRYYAGLYDDSRDADEALADVGLANTGDTWYENLSGGQQRRACVAATLVNDPDVLFLDEPTTGIDPAGRRALWSLVEDLAEGGTTVFLTTHYMAEAERLADRVGLLANGELVAVGTPESLITDHGGESRLVVETDARRSAIETQFTIEETESGLVFDGVTPGDIGDVVSDLNQRDIDYGALTWTEPDLEDVYLRLTGASLGPEVTRKAGQTAIVGGDR